MFETLDPNSTTTTDASSVGEVRLLGVEDLDVQLAARTVLHPVDVESHHPAR